MSARLFPTDILFFQRLLKAMGLYSGALNGVWGSAMSTAESAFFARTAAVADEIGRFDPRSETTIGTLHLAAQPACRRFLKTVRAGGFDARVISGTRTYEEQNELYRRGRFGNPPPIVTNARGGRSNHNFGIAWDVGVFVRGRYLTGKNQAELKAYEDVAGLRDANLLEWGGEWATFKDRPHYQLR
jgi:peptidoglycan L-alanyl-D-glutamate endopeptidase CwlK